MKSSIAIAFAVAVTAVVVVHASPIRLKAETIDPSAKTVRLLKASAMSPTVPARGLYLVQPVNGEVTDEWRCHLEELGAKIRSYIPDDTYLVEIPGDRYTELAENLPHSYIGEFKPEYRYDAAELPSELATASGERSKRLLAASPESEEDAAADSACFDILLFERGTAEVVSQKIAALDGCMVVEASGRRIRAVLTAAAVKEIASWPDVHWIERFQESVPDLDMALKSERANVESVWDGGATLLGLTGANQVIGIADTGLDSGTNSTLHLDIRNRLVYWESVSGRGKLHDQSGHGTHVVGCAMGNGRRSGGGIRGPAYEAKLVMQSTLKYDSGKGIDIPVDIEGMFQTAYDKGARVHNNSYGKGDKGDPRNHYIDVCEGVDNFVFEHPDMTLVWSAGNNGVDISPTNGVADSSTLNGYAAAKNSIVVGASENLQTGDYSRYVYSGEWNTEAPIFGDSYSKPYDGKNQGLAAFSGRGPTTDGRIRPDIVAPGTGIVAMRSSLAEEPRQYARYDDYYRYNQGTSMSAPIVAGSAALVRQWMTEQYGVESPDAATVKAILLAGAKSLAPGQYGTGSFREIPSTYPNNAEGWGQLNLSNSLANVTGVYVQNAKVIGNSDSKDYRIAAPKGRPVTFMLAWTDAPGDPSASESANKRVNALNFTVTRDDGKTYTVNPGGSTGATVLGVRIPASEMASAHVFTARVWTASSSIKRGMDTSLTGGTKNATRYSLVVNGGRAYGVYWHAYFHYNNGTGSVKTNLVNVGATLYDFMPKPNRSGYLFDGWYTAANGGTRISHFEIMKSGAVKHLYAHWRPANDDFADATAIFGTSGAVSRSTQNASVQSGEPLPKFKNAATNTVWWAWTASENGNVVFDTTDTAFDTVMGVYTGASLAALTKVAEDDDGGPERTSICSFMAAKGTTYYIAVSGYGNNNQGIVNLAWSLASNTYTVRYRKYDGSGETASEDFECDKTYTLAWLGSELGWARPGYEFVGWVPWNPDTKPRLCKYDNGQPVKDLAMAGETINLWAGWKSSSSYRVCFHRCAGPDDLTKMNQVILRNKEDNLAWMDSMIGWKREGYTFLGWDESEKASAVKYANGAKVKNLAMDGGTKHLYAVWRAKDDHKYPYTVRFYKYDGSGETRDQSFKAGTVQSLLWMDSQLGWSRPGYEFVGWVPWNPDTKPRLCKYVNGQKVVDLASKSGEVVNLWAAWKSSSSYRVCFHLNDGNDVKMNQVILRNKDDNLAWMDSQIGWKREGYVFKGWAEKEGTSTVKYANGAKVKNLAMDGGTKHLYAIWRVAD